MPKVVAVDVNGNLAEINVTTGGGGNFGVALLDFGSGQTDASLAVTGQTDIASDSTVIAQVMAKASDDHSIDEHVVEEITVRAGNIVAGTGFTIYGRTNNFPLRGQWSVAWTWG